MSPVPHWPSATSDDEDDQHGDDVQQQLQPLQRAARHRRDGIGILTLEAYRRRIAERRRHHQRRTDIATGVATNEATRRWPSASGTTWATKVAYSTSTVRRSSPCRSSSR